MNFIFIVDTSFSMLQYFDRNYTYIDCVKNIIEFFIKSKLLRTFYISIQ